MGQNAGIVLADFRERSEMKRAGEFRILVHQGVGPCSGQDRRVVSREKPGYVGARTRHRRSRAL